MNDLAILRMADAMARHASGRHALVAENIANADTPGYRSRDFAPFDVALKQGPAQRATRPTHLSGGASVSFEARQDAVFGAESPNGNDVALPDQLNRAAQSLGAHDRAMTIYRKTMDIMRLGLGRR